MLGIVHASALYAVPLRDASGEIVDFLMADVNEHALGANGDTATDMRGTRMLEHDPGIALSGLFDEYVRVYETGRPLVRGPFEYIGLRERPWPMTVTVRAARAGDGVVVSWRSHDQEERLAARWRAAERLAGLGWGEWNLVTDETVWTSRMFAIFGRDRADGPIPLAELAELALPEDLGDVEEHARTLLEHGRPVDGEFRIRRADGGVRHIRALYEPVLDEDGVTTAIRTIASDITERRRRDRALVTARAEVAREHQAVRQLRAAVLPFRQGLTELPGLNVAIRYLAAENTARVGGDWCKARELPDGRVLLALGDAMGHGLEAAALMTQMRAGLSGLAYTGAEVDQLAHWLNELVRNEAQDDTVTGTAVLGHFCPSDRTLRWTRAGHPAPILMRRGRARLLDAPAGPLLGVLESEEYPVVETRLEQGDIVLLYTDGIIDRRDADPDTLTAALLGASAPAADPENCIDLVLNALHAADTDDDICLMAFEVR